MTARTTGTTSGGSAPTAGAGRGAERGSGSVLAVAVLGAITTISLLLVTVLGLLVLAGQLRTAADAAALAAADTASGLLSGVPCESAKRTATLNNVQLTGCTVDGLVATVTATRMAGGLVLSVQARAGPPGSAPAGADSG